MVRKAELRWRSSSWACSGSAERATPPVGAGRAAEGGKDEAEETVEGWAAEPERGMVARAGAGDDAGVWSSSASGSEAGDSAEDPGWRWLPDRKPDPQASKTARTTAAKA